MWILPLLGYLGWILGFVFMVLAIASGLYYLSELVEEHSVPAKKILTRLIYSVDGLLALLVLDGFPWYLIAFSVASHVVYQQNLRHFPLVKLSNPTFILSCVLVLVNHYLWFRHFSKPPAPSPSSSSYPYSRYSGRDPYTHYPSFTEVASFFGICVWLVPFSLFVSLSASENVLPSVAADYQRDAGRAAAAASSSSGAYDQHGQLGMNGFKKERSGMAKAAVDGVRAWVGQSGQLLGVWSAEQSKRHVF